MIITFVSNYINHHQLPFCRAMLKYAKDISFYFIQTMPMEEKRISMGWGIDTKELGFVILGYKDEERAKKLILESDVVLLGWTEGLLGDAQEKRLSSGKLTFRVSERIYREGQWKVISPRGLIKKYQEHIRYRNMPVYLLCTGAYVASDFSLIKSYPGKMLKWGYFPDARTIDRENEGKINVTGPLKLCWAGRLIKLKHPEFAIRLAADLKEKYSFKVDMIGDGPLKRELSSMIEKRGLKGVVNLLGGKKPQEVLEYMREADVFLFTSNYLEGWGAVVNEAMQCECALVASEEAGAVPYLLRDGINGLVYEDGSYENFKKKVIYLFEHRNKVGEFSGKAKETIDEIWNADNAAKELLRFCREYFEEKKPEPAAEGPVSRAEIVKVPGIRRTMQEKNRLE